MKFDVVSVHLKKKQKNTTQTINEIKNNINNKTNPKQTFNMALRYSYGQVESHSKISLVFSPSITSKEKLNQGEMEQLQINDRKLNSGIRTL